MNRQRPDAEVIVVGLAALAVYAAVAYLLVVRLNVFSGDAVARTYSAKSIVLGSEPKLANVGFVWAPLPTLLQVPLVLFPPLRYRSLAGNLLTALMGAGTVVLLCLFLRQVNLSRPLRWTILAGFALNPMILLYSANGMSEMTLLFFAVLAAYFYWRWQHAGHWTYLTGAGLAAAAACLSRYDGVFVAGLLAAAIGVEAYTRRANTRYFSESTVLMFGAPVAYGLSLWVLGNWIIMGDPLFFARSPLSLSSRLGGLLLGREWVVPLKGNLLGTVQATLAECWALYPPFLVLTAVLGLLILYRRSGQWLGVLIVAWSLVLFTSFNIFIGGSQYSLRYFISAIPMSFVLAAGVLQLLDRWRLPAALLLAALFAASAFSSEQAMRRPDPFDNDHVFVPALLRQRPAEVFDTEREFAHYIDTHTRGSILVDDFQGNQIIVFSNQPGRFVTSSHSMFTTYLSDPVGHVDYFLVNRPAGYIDLVNQAYPDLYERGGPWVKLERESGLWKLYRVVGPPRQVPLVDPRLQVAPP